jgi:hypothetical protein
VLVGACQVLVGVVWCVFGGGGGGGGSLSPPSSPPPPDPQFLDKGQKAGSITRLDNVPTAAKFSNTKISKVLEQSTAHVNASIPITSHALIRT